MKRMFLIAGLLLAGGTAHAAGQVYTGSFEGGSGQLELNGKTATLSMGSSNCMGMLGHAPFVRNGNTIEITQPSEGHGPACHVKLTVKGNKIINSQEENCSEWHGASCSFNG